MNLNEGRADYKRFLNVFLLIPLSRTNLENLEVIELLAINSHMFILICSGTRKIKNFVDHVLKLYEDGTLEELLKNTSVVVTFQRQKDIK